MHMQSISFQVKKKKRFIIQSEFFNFSYQKNFKISLTTSWKNPISTFFDIQSRLVIIPATLVWEPQNSQITQIWHTLHPFTDSAVRKISKKYYPYKCPSGSDTCCGCIILGESEFPPQENSGKWLLPVSFFTVLNGTHFMFLSENVCFTVFDRAKCVFWNRVSTGSALWPLVV